MSRLQPLFARLKSENRKAMGLFVTNGFPDLNSMSGVLDALVKGGADFIELGMPFSDPLAEGLPIQRSSARALAQGVGMDDAFATVEAFRQRHQTPLLLMGYFNPIQRYGLGNFCARAASCGVDGLILPDVPPEESALLEQEAARVGLDLVFLVAPNTPDARMHLIDKRATGFVYAVSVSGLTGTALGDLDRVSDYLARARTAITRNPLLVGFGIRNSSDAARLSRHTDGFIVGSALIEIIEALWNDSVLDADTRLGRLQAFVQSLRPLSLHTA